MFGHSSGAQQPLLHGGAHHSPYGGQGHHNHHNPHHHNNAHHHQHHHHPHHTPHHNFHHGYGRHWYRPWVSFSFRPAPIVQPSLPHTHADIVVVDPRPRFRFLKAIIYTIIIWLLIGALIRSLTTDWVWGYKSQLASARWAIGPGNVRLDYPVPPGVDLTSCESPLASGGSGDATFQIPSSSDTLLLFSDGRLLYGSVQITTTSAETDSVTFTVSLSSKRRLPADTIVCSLKRGDGEEGVGIYNTMEERRDLEDAIRYHVIVELPENHPVVKRFETNVINSAHDIDDLQGKILFEALSLHGSNGGIHSKSISTRWADISTSNGPIDGYFNASDFLKIQTVNGRIEVDVDFNQDTSDKAVLSLSTRNSPLKANLRLYDVATSRSTPGNFDVTAETINSPLNIAVLDAPVDSTLSLQASSAVSPAEVTLHPTFEGHFSLSSTLLGVAVHKRSGVEDPSGKGRDRFVNYRNIRGGIDGDVAWGEGPKENRGRVNISSSIGRVTLNL